METAIAIFHGLGDCINATSLIIPIIKKYPNTKIVWVTSTVYAPVAYHNPYISKIHEITELSSWNKEFPFQIFIYNLIICVSNCLTFQFI